MLLFEQISARSGWFSVEEGILSIHISTFLHIIFTLWFNRQTIYDKCNNNKRIKNMIHSFNSQQVIFFITCFFKH